MAVTWGYFWKALPLIGKGDYDDARKTVEDGLVLTEKMGDEVMHQRLLNISGWLHGELGDFERAIDLNRRCADGARKRGDPETVANAELNIADILMGTGNLTELTDAALAIEGAHGMLSEGGDGAVAEWSSQFLTQPGFHIGGGTDEIQRNIIGERVLGLPHDLDLS